jgi:hypothetical protein
MVVTFVVSRLKCCFHPFSYLGRDRLLSSSEVIKNSVNTDLSNGESIIGVNRLVKANMSQPASKGSRTTAKRSTKSAGKQRLSQLARENQITNDQEELICEAFNLFSLNGIEGYEGEEHGVLRIQDVRRALMLVRREIVVAYY